MANRQTNGNGDDTPDPPNNQLTVLRDPSVYENAQDLIAIGVVRKVWRIFFGSLAILGAFLAWSGYDFRKNREILLEEIKGLKVEIESEREKAKEIVKELETEITVKEKQIDDLNDEIKIARSLPYEYIEIISKQSNIVGQLTADTKNQLNNSKHTLKQLSNADNALLAERNRVNIALEELDKFQKEIRQTLVPLENKILYRWDEVLLSERIENIQDLGLSLRFKTDNKTRSMEEVELWDESKPDELLCSTFTLRQKDSRDINTQKGGLFRMTNRYLVDAKGSGVAVGLRFERLDPQLESEQDRPTCSI